MQSTHLDQLESEAIYIIREGVARCNKPMMLFSGGKDSIVMAHLALKAFWPALPPFPLVHIDTGHNFAETIQFRDDFVKKHQFELVVGSVEESIDQGLAIEEKGRHPSRNAIQSVTLNETINAHHFDCCFGGGRRDEEKARAKERFFSHRDAFGQWQPKNQRPELWHLFNTLKHTEENFRVFPLSNWTEIDVWEYIEANNIELPSLYFSHQREVFYREGVIYADVGIIPRDANEEVLTETVRYRTIGDVTCTGAVKSPAEDVRQVIEEIIKSTVTERGGRSDDKRSESAMEDRKLQGYF